MRPWGQTIKPRLVAFARQSTLLLATIPFALLANSSSVSTTLTIERDGGALRQIVATASPYFRDQLPKWVNDVRAGYPWDRTWQESGASSYTYMRDYRTSNAEYSDQGRLTIVDVLQNPLSIYTTYTWKETINFAHLYESDIPAAAAAGKELQYKVIMPGTVTDSAVQPSKGSSANNEGRAAVLTIPADEPSATVTVTSQKVRWGYLLIVIYVLAWIALEIVQVVGRQLRRRPRKI